MIGPWLIALAATVAIELLIAAVFWRPRVPWIDVTLVNLFTHPFAVLAIEIEPGALIAIEFGVTAAEALAYVVVTRLPWRRALAVSVVCNVVTTLVGIAFGPW